MGKKSYKSCAATFQLEPHPHTPSIATFPPKHTFWHSQTENFPEALPWNSARGCPQTSVSVLFKPHTAQTLRKNEDSSFSLFTVLLFSNSHQLQCGQNNWGKTEIRRRNEHDQRMVVGNQSQHFQQIAAPEPCCMFTLPGWFVVSVLLHCQRTDH